jgi:hypothetical protein
VSNPFDEIPVGRRVFIGGLAALAAASSALALSERLRHAVLPQKFDRRAARRPAESRVAILGAEDYVAIRSAHPRGRTVQAGCGAGASS